jgi:hypothetical protein
MGKHSSCPNCNCTDAHVAIYKCVNGHLFCSRCASSKGIVHTYCAKCKEGASKIGEIGRA